MVDRQVHAGDGAGLVRQAVDPHAAAAPFGGEVLGQPDHGRLHRPVGVQRRRAHAGDRREVEDGAPAPHCHPAAECDAGPMGAQQVDAEHPLEGLELQLLGPQRRALDDARRVDRHRHRADLALDPFRQRLQVGREPDLDRIGLACARLLAPPVTTAIRPGMDIRAPRGRRARSPARSRGSRRRPPAGIPAGRRRSSRRRA